MKELVVAAYDKSLDWLSFVSDDIKKTVYRKGSALPLQKDEILLHPNTGRCVHTFFNHLVVRYDNLSDYTFFCQDFPFDHWGNIVDVVNGEVHDISRKSSLTIGGYHGFHNNNFGSAWSMPLTKQFGEGNVLSCLGNGHPHHLTPGVDVDKYWSELFDCENPKEYEFIPGGHFAITRDQVRTRSKKFYEKVCNILLNDINAPWNFERLECYIFNDKYVSKL